MLKQPTCQRRQRETGKEFQSLAVKGVSYFKSARPVGNEFSRCAILTTDAPVLQNGEGVPYRRFAKRTMRMITRSEQGSTQFSGQIVPHSFNRLTSGTYR